MQLLPLDSGTDNGGLFIRVGVYADGIDPKARDKAGNATNQPQTVRFEAFEAGKRER